MKMYLILCSAGLFLAMFFNGVRDWTAYVVYWQLMVLYLLVSAAAAMWLAGTVDKRRRIAVIFGSDSDFKQCYEGLKFLELQADRRDIRLLSVCTNSVHRNMFTLFLNLLILWIRRVDVIILCAGWAAHLPGMAWAFYSFALRVARITIIPVGMDADPGISSQPDHKDYPIVKQRNEAARSSISEVPGNSMYLLKLPGGQLAVFFGDKGFFTAAVCAVHKTFAVHKLPARKPPVRRTIAEAVKFAEGGKKSQ